MNLWAWWIPEDVDKSQSHLLKDERLDANARLRDVSYQIIRDFSKHSEFMKSYKARLLDSHWMSVFMSYNW